MPQLTVIIPFLGKTNSQLLEETLVSVLENRQVDSEILVVCDVKYDDPYHLSDEGVQFLTFSHAESVVQRINAAVEVAKAPVICLLSSGTEVCENWDEYAVRSFYNTEVAVAIPRVCSKRQNSRQTSSGVIYRSSGAVRSYQFGQRITNGICLAPHVACAFFRRSALHKVGGFCNRFCQQIAYVDYCLTVEHLGLQTVLLPSSQVISGQSLQLFPTPFQQSQQLEQLFQLWSHRGSWYGNITQHFFAVSAEFWGVFPRFRAYQYLAGRIFGLNHYGAHRLRKQELKRLAEEFVTEKYDTNDIDHTFTEKNENRVITKAA